MIKFAIQGYCHKLQQQPPHAIFNLALRYINDIHMSYFHIYTVTHINI